MIESSRPSNIRKRLLKQRGVELKRLTRKPVTVDDLPSAYRKTRLMRYIELKFGKHLEDLIMVDATIYELEKKLKVDASTISKWRKLLNETFWGNFDDKQL